MNNYFTTLLVSTFVFISIASCSSENSSRSTSETVNCNSSKASSAVIRHLLDSGVIEYQGQVRVEKTVVLNEDCDFIVELRFYLDNLAFGDFSRNFRVTLVNGRYEVY